LAGVAVTAVEQVPVTANTVRYIGNF
jgi:hypothetical protein